VITTSPVEREAQGIIDHNDGTTPTALGAGKSLFMQNCAACHAIMKDMTGPALSGLQERGPWNDRKKLYGWIHNPPAFMVTNHYAQVLKEKFGVMMTAFPALSEKDIDAIVDYINSSQKDLPVPVALR
jgi:mono/diheme cytochrome c family protein